MLRLTAFLRAFDSKSENGRYSSHFNMLNGVPITSTTTYNAESNHDQFRHDADQSADANRRLAHCAPRQHQTARSRPHGRPPRPHVPGRSHPTLAAAVWGFGFWVLSFKTPPNPTQNHFEMDPRREFLGSSCCAAVGLTGLISSLASLRLMGAVAQPNSEPKTQNSGPSRAAGSHPHHGLGRPARRSDGRVQFE